MGAASAANSVGGAGGFGGGGGGGGSVGGAGGFGGGGGGFGGAGGFGGGNGSQNFSAVGGGGGGLGGAIFVVAGGTLTVAGAGGTAASDGVTAGASGGGDAAAGSAFGKDIFIQGANAITFSPGAGNTYTIVNSIADEAGSGGNPANMGSLVLSGGGTLVLSAANTYTGGTTVSAGTLTLGNSNALGTGSLSLAAGTALSFANTGSFNIANNISISGDPTITTIPGMPPGASFVVNGAAQAADTALTTASIEMKWKNNWSVAATFGGEFSNVTSSYAGKGVVRYQW